MVPPVTFRSSGLLTGALVLLPLASQAQTAASLHAVLAQIYDEMIPLCSQLTGVARGLGSFAALFYIAVRVWRHLAAAEPVDLFPLLRPFALGFCIVAYPSVLALINGLLKPVTTVTEGMVTRSNQAIETLLEQKQKALEQTDTWQMYVGLSGEGDRDRWFEYTHEALGEGPLESLGHDVEFAMAKAAYRFRNSVKEWMSEVLQLLFEAAALCINTIRTFTLIVLAILGPLVFGIAIFDGFQATLTAWLARYVQVYLWLPVANLFGSIIGKIQENLLKLDLQQIDSTGDTFFSPADSAYLVFLLMGILGYVAVPSVASYLVQSSGSQILQMRVTQYLSRTASGIQALLASSKTDRS